MTLYLFLFTSLVSSGIVPQEYGGEEEQFAYQLQEEPAAAVEEIPHHSVSGERQNYDHLIDYYVSIKYVLIYYRLELEIFLF